MEDKKLLIVGIDPGITTACAVLDIEGRLVYANSSKQFELRRLISEIIEFGKVILVGTDKAKIPSLVQEFAAKLGARIVNPKEDLKVNDKKIMTSKFDFRDEHEMDALAAALLAYKDSKPLLDRIDKYSEENKKQQIKNKIKELVINKKISIKNAVSIIEKKDEESSIIEKAIIERNFSEEDFLKLYRKLKSQETELTLVKDYNKKLREKISEMQNLLNAQEPKADARKANDFREIRIKSLENSIKIKEKNSEHLKMVIGKYNNILSNLNNFHVLKKLDTLGLKEFEYKNRILNIQKNDILLVDDPNIFSKDVIRALKEKVLVIAFKRQISKKIENELPFVFINASRMKLEEDKYFAFIDRKTFDSEKNRSGWVRKIIEDYKKEKEQLTW